MESGGERDDTGTQFFEKLFVGAVLFLRSGQIDRLPIDEGNFAMDYGRTDGAGDGGEHLTDESLHENRMT